MKYTNRNKKPVVERPSRLAKTIAVFGIVIRKDGYVLVVQDNPKKGRFQRWADSESFYKFSGGKVSSGENKVKILPQKIREETRVSSIYLSPKREPIFSVEKGSHLKLFYLMKYIQGDPLPGKNIKFADFFSPTEIEEKIKKGEFLVDHKLALEKYFETLAS